VPEQWHRWNFPLKPILDQALRWHASTINIKSSRIPADWKAAFDAFQKQIGYRFVLKKLEYPSHVTRGSMAAVNMWWFNAGVAPVYRDYTLAIKFAAATNSAIVPLTADVKKWLPGDAVFDGPLYVPDGLTPGAYRLCLALLDARAPRGPRSGSPFERRQKTAGMTWAL
jgi:hypothetical protein